MASSTSVYDLMLQAIHENSQAKFLNAINDYEDIAVVSFLCQPNEQGESLPVVALKNKYFDVVHTMIQCLQCCCEDAYSQPILDAITSAIKPLFCHQFPVMEVMDCLIVDLTGYDTNYTIYYWLHLIITALECSPTSREERIIALELIGASAVLLSHRLLGFSCWKEAMALRYFPADGGPLIPKIPVHIQSDMADKIIGNAVEVTSMEQLEQWSNNIVNTTVREIEVQALLVYQRIVSQVDPGQTRPYYFHLKALLEYGLALKLRHEFNRAINIYHLILEQIVVFEPNVACPKRLVAIFKDTFGYMLNCFRKMQNLPIDNPEREELSPANLLRVIKLCTTIGNYFSITQRQESAYLNYYSDDYLKLIYDFVLILDYISPLMNHEDSQQLREYLYFYCSTVVPFGTNTTYPLHGAVYEEFDLKYIKLLLECGADPQAYDSYGESALHVLARSWNSSEMDAYCFGVFQTLINAGVHLDIADLDGETVISILTEKRTEYNMSHIVDSVINTIFPLSCHCARVIRRHGIPYEEQLPPVLKTFVRLHSAKGINK